MPVGFLLGSFAIAASAPKKFGSRYGLTREENSRRLSHTVTRVKKTPNRYTRRDGTGRRSDLSMKKAALISATFVLACIVSYASLATHTLPTTAAAPATNIPPPPASAPAGTPFADIGALERDRKTPPQKLQPYLNSSDPVIVARAVVALGRIRNSAAIPVVTSVLNNPKSPDAVRESAAFALGLFASPDSIDVLNTAATHESVAVASAATEALGRIGGPRVIEILTQQLGSRHTAVRGAAAVGLGEAGLPGAPAIDEAHRQSAARALAAAILAERDPEAKWRMAWALSRAFYQNQSAVLRRMLIDDQELVRLFAVRGLGKLKDRSYLLPIRLAANDHAWRVRVEVKNALDLFHDRTKVNLTAPAVPPADLKAPDPVPTSAPYGDHPEVAFDTSKGVIVVELFPEQAPYSVDNFLYLTDRGFYNGLSYFRVIADFVIQGGDPKNTGDGGPGYSIPAELNPLQQLTGIISYGLDYDPKKNVPLLDSAGSQYYITESPQLHLDRAFTVFGRVVKGMAVVDAITPHQASDTTAADIARRVYRCKPVISQSAEIEQKLRTSEIGYNPG